MRSERFDSVNQFFHAPEGTAFDGALGDDAKPARYLVQPGGVSRREVDMEARAFGEPGADPVVFVRGIVVHDQVNVQIFRHIAFDVAKKGQEFLMSMFGFALADHCAVGDIQGWANKVVVPCR